jgi:hypothetical protein
MQHMPIVVQKTRERRRFVFAVKGSFRLPEKNKEVKA